MKLNRVDFGRCKKFWDSLPHDILLSEAQSNENLASYAQHHTKISNIQSAINMLAEISLLSAQASVLGVEAFLTACEQNQRITDAPKTLEERMNLGGIEEFLQMVEEAPRQVLFSLLPINCRKSVQLAAKYILVRGMLAAFDIISTENKKMILDRQFSDAQDEKMKLKMLAAKMRDCADAVEFTSESSMEVDAQQSLSTTMSDDEARSMLQSRTVAQLRSIAKVRSIDIKGLTKKDAIISAMIKAGGSQIATAEPASTVEVSSSVVEDDASRSGMEKMNKENEEETSQASKTPGRGKRKATATAATTSKIDRALKRTKTNNSAAHEFETSFNALNPIN